MSALDYAGSVEPFRLFAGDDDCSVILHVPHSSRELTSFARDRIRLDDAALSVELDRITDAHTELIATRAADAAVSRPWLFANRYSRLVVDPERFPDDRERMGAVGMSAVYTRTSHNAPLRDDDPEHIEQLLARHYRPYAQGMTEVVQACLAATGRAVIIDVHSYPREALPYERAYAAAYGLPDAERPPLCLGADAVHSPVWLVDAARAAFALPSAVNTPFTGCYVPLRHYRTALPTSVLAVMVEIRRDTYLAGPGGPPTSGLDALVVALASLVERAQAGAPVS
jgi:N-formylglutamate deformylase